MRGGIKVTGLAETRQFIEDLPDDMFPPVRDIFAESVFNVHEAVSRRLTGTPMKSRTGLLRKSLKTEISGTSLETLRASVFAAGTVGGKPVVYAPIHEYGGTVKAKRAYRNVPGGPYLNIPLSSNLTPSGVTRLSPGEVFQLGGRILKTRSGKYGVFLGGRMMYILKKEVRIKARLGMRAEADKEIPNLLQQLREL